jgi:hypothetical protein
MDGLIDTLARNPEILAGIFFLFVAAAVIRFVSGWVVKAGAVLVVLVLLGVVSSETAKGWALDGLRAGAAFMQEAFVYVVLDGGDEGSTATEVPGASPAATDSSADEGAPAPDPGG